MVFRFENSTNIYIYSGLVIRCMEPSFENGGVCEDDIFTYKQYQCLPVFAL